jgi:hypothetical protein
MSMAQRDLKTENDAEREMVRRVLRLNVKGLGISLALLFGLAVFIATNWLVIKGGKPVGPHLQLLSQYFAGYSVTFRGSLIGFLYGALLGAFVGTLMGWVYNGIVGLKRNEKDSA